MKLQETTLPWNAAPARSTENLWPYFAECLGPVWASYLPRSITIFADPEIDESAVRELIGGMENHLAGELEIRNRRRNRFIDLKLFDEAQIDAFLINRCHLQPWVIYYSRNGGLKTPVLDPSVTRARYGVVPCATMQNHGVVWLREESADDYRLWLVTARKEGQAWDWDSDIGHESAHAAFAQIPLYIQTDEKSATLFSLKDVNEIAELNSYQLARMSYMYMETAVVAMRGERRENETGLPLAEQADELHSFLKISAQLMPHVGFDRALLAFERSKGGLDFESGPEILEIGAAAMRVVPHISKRLNTIAVPTCEWFQSLQPA